MITTVVQDVWCEKCLTAYPDVVLDIEGDYGEGHCPEGHKVQVVFEAGDL